MSEAVVTVTFEEYLAIERAGVRHELIVEVLSPSSVGTDRREKFEAYRLLASLEIYLLADPVFRRFEVYRPNPSGQEPNWQAYGPGQQVFTPYEVLDLDEIYGEVDGLATT